MGILSGPIMSRLGGVLRNAGGGMLRDIIVRNLPEAGPVVDAIAARLGIPISTDRDQTAGEIIARYEADRAALPPGEPSEVEIVAAAVEAERADEWAKALQNVAAAAIAREETMRSEAESAYWPVRYWRPIFAIIAAVSFPVSIVLLFILLRSPVVGVPNPFEAATIFAGFCVVVLPVALGVLGVYVGARSFEKGRGVTD